MYAGQRMTIISYNPPAITDHGSLVDLTADFDLTFVGSVAKVVSLAAVSPAIINPGGGEVPNANNPGGAPETVNVLSGGGGSGGTPEVINDSPEVLSDVGSGGPGESDVTGAPGGVAGSGGSGGGAAGGGGGGGGGDLPFTGYPAMLSAAAGAALTTAGVTLRSKLRRKS